jgi:preprotein translocase subunit YajC
MSIVSALSALLAQAENGAAPEAPGGNAFTSLFPLLVIGLLFYFILLRPERRKHKEHAELLGNLKKNDKVVTIGGIYGKVYDVQRDQDRVTLKIDEANNTKIDVTFAAIARVISETTAEPEKSTK